MKDWQILAAGAAVAAVAVFALVRYDATQNGPDANDDKRALATSTGLIGGKAPDFTGDFAVNGAPGRLSDLRGKVVLLDFWAVWCGPCVQALPEMQALHAKYHGDGLAVVGVTDYNCENGRYYGFDKTKGKVLQLDVGNVDTERAMLKDFAAYHKVEYLMMALPPAEAGRTYSAYQVEGIPQAVLIDRRGVVQMVKVGATKANLRALEAELKTLLAQK